MFIGFALLFGLLPYNHVVSSTEVSIFRAIEIMVTIVAGGFSLKRVTIAILMKPHVENVLKVPIFVVLEVKMGIILKAHHCVTTRLTVILIRVLMTITKARISSFVEYFVILSVAIRFTTIGVVEAIWAFFKVGVVGTITGFRESSQVVFIGAVWLKASFVMSARGTAIEVQYHRALTKLCIVSKIAYRVFISPISHDTPYKHSLMANTAATL
jgi:hypothetical protein